VVGGGIRLITFSTEPAPIGKILTHLGEPFEPPPLSFVEPGVVPPHLEGPLLGDPGRGDLLPGPARLDPGERYFPPGRPRGRG